MHSTPLYNSNSSIQAGASLPRLAHPEIWLLVFFQIELKFTLHKVNHLKLYNSVAFSIFTMLYNHHLYLLPRTFDHPQGIPCTC